jgi:hypothetical protein
MSVHHYYRLCCRHYGKPARIIDRAGRRHFGRIVKVTPTHVHIQPSRRRIAGFGYGYYRPWGGYGGYGGYGYGYNTYAVPLSFIAGLIVGGIFS